MIKLHVDRINDQSACHAADVEGATLGAVLEVNAVPRVHSLSAKHVHSLPTTCRSGQLALWIVDAWFPSENALTQACLTSVK